MKISKEFFDEEQMKEIKLGLEFGLDVSIYADPKFNHHQMDKIRLWLITKK